MHQQCMRGRIHFELILDNSDSDCGGCDTFNSFLAHFFLHSELVPLRPSSIPPHISSKCTQLHLHSVRFHTIQASIVPIIVYLNGHNEKCWHFHSRTNNKFIANGLAVVPRWSKTFKWFWWTVCWKGTKWYCSTIYFRGWMNDWLTAWVNTGKRKMYACLRMSVCVCVFLFVNVVHTLITFAEQLFETIIVLNAWEKWRSRLRVRYFNICIL